MGALYKSPNVLVFRRPNQSGVFLVNARTRTTLALDEAQADQWFAWPVESMSSTLMGRLVDGGFAETRPQAQFVAPTPADGLVLRPAQRWAKWYKESEDLVVLFNSAPMRQNNPLLVLGPYGALCWKAVLSRTRVGDLRSESWRVFGVDEVTSFLRRLTRLGFIECDVESLGPEHDEHVVKEFRAPEIQFQLVQSRVPWYCLWEVCRVCDLRCKVCYLPDFNHSGPSTTEATDIAQQLIDAGIFYVCLLGGETLLRQDLEQIVGQLRDAGVFTKIITNGQRLIPDRARSLAHAGINMVEVSFDGLSPKMHEASRGVGTFARAVSALQNARYAGVPRAGVVWTIHSHNQDELSKLPEFLEQHGVAECYLSPFKKTGLNGLKAPWSSLQAHELSRVGAAIAEWRVTHPDLTIVLQPACSCGRTSVVIGASGDARLCSFSYDTIGNITDTPLLDVWGRAGEALTERGAVGFCNPKLTRHRARELPLMEIADQA
jgi:MoaA/NifB/PqqE/SkfB family radical SAM enzyme